MTTLWFWNTEIGWATVHPLLAEAGWEYRNCHVWNKGIGHIAGNCNSQTIRKFPVVTEVCVQYVREVRFQTPSGSLTMKEWLRHEWERTGLPLSATNEACGVRNAATRKYFTSDHMWYFPPAEAFERFVTYANQHGRPEGRPYFSQDGRVPISGQDWSRMRAKFYCEHGVVNVWDEPPMHGEERLKDHENRCVHLNQKPLSLLGKIIRASSDPGDVVWEPFGGLCSTAVACRNLGRHCYSAEISPEFFRLAKIRLENERAKSSRPATPGKRLEASRPVRSGKRNPLRAPSLFQA
jgi:site-specific DNA-methyltransferase (adenine-specific)